MFLALAAIGWADDNLDEEEADAIVRLALEEGLEIDEIAEIVERPLNTVKTDLRRALATLSKELSE